MVHLVISKFLPDDQKCVVLACCSSIERAYEILKSYQELREKGFSQNCVISILSLPLI